MKTRFAAHLFTLLAAIVIAFQIALAMGMPWGHLTWGGKYPGQLPEAMRAVAIFSVALLTVFALIIETRTGVLFPVWKSKSRVLVCLVVAYCALGVVMNAITPSFWERMIWLPVVLAMLVCSFVVAVE